MPPTKRQLSSYSKDGSPISPTDIKGSQFEDDNGFGSTKGDVKPQKACVQCRRSKVKCVHEGGPPCRRCTDTKQECKFRLRADDETWRERTDERLDKLTMAVETHILRSASSAPQQPAPSNRPILPVRNASAPGFYTHHHPFSPGHHPPPLSTFGTAMPSPHLPNRFATMNGLPPLNSPHSDPPVHILNSPNHDLNGSHDAPSPGYNRRLLPRKRESSSFDVEAHHHPSPQTPSQSGRVRSNSTQRMPPPLPPMTMNADQWVPPPMLSQLAYRRSPVYIPDLFATPRWTSAQPKNYSKATSTIGASDPRFSVIRMGLITMDKAKSLFISFADKLQPHSFGFPTYPASEAMTPVIIAAILTVSSLFEPSSRLLHDSLRKTFFNEYVKLEQEVHLDTPLDPELGIGVEEITGGCIASAWLGGELGWKTARMTRWWAIGYLKHFEIAERNVTIGERFDMLPPFRQIDYVDKLRIFLAAYVAEAQQSFMLDRPTLIPDASPTAYVDALRNALNDYVPASPASANGMDTRGSMTGGSQKDIHTPDRQLTGHASILYILLEAQRLQRETRWAISAEESRLATYGHSPNGVAVNYATVNECVDRMIHIWTSWMEQTEHWYKEAAKLEDLSSNTASALDLSLTHRLVNAYLGSLAYNPEYHANAAVARAASKDPRLLHVQTRMIKMAMVEAFEALESIIMKSRFRDRLIYLPNFYHFLLVNSASFLLHVLHDKSLFLREGKAKSILEMVEQFTQFYVSELTNLNLDSTPGSSGHSSMTSAQALARACHDFKSQIVTP
ncbi:uncharacterized protein FA14DRAFT_24955 [Meira miltonrushii]|uniref:Zn(2)-C6 fungal-type domain-containing protein n=1 Tax=Meira miltonrushii TaxID=1280837 RepID=A0A316VRZ9_9BASI|nr:uncharacterized protein FA14DRAFT_24955 [Meira miltonrushii]PWN38275.1 hypothetical protein FA14DRAFT_24955 [Meira miltonrushii]